MKIIKLIEEIQNTHGRSIARAAFDLSAIKLQADNPYKSALLGEDTEFEKFIKKAKENTKIYKQNI